MYRIGPYVIDKPTILAPMAGVTDLPFRQLCRANGAGLTVSEMVTADIRLWHSEKSRLRLPHEDEPAPRAVQIAGGDADMLANAARENVRLGAQIIDINMGCPAKKVCRKAAGSALLRDEKLVAEILEAVVLAVDVPVTLKIRTGWEPDHRNGVTIARIAEAAGISALAVHGRTRACRFKGEAEYDTIAEIVQAVDMPVFANGDIDSPEKARRVLNHTGAAAVMIGRAAQGAPWLFRQINDYLAGGVPQPVTPEEIRDTVLAHLSGLHAFHGEYRGVRIARKHVGWYLATLPGGEAFRQRFNRLEQPGEQRRSLDAFFNNTKNDKDLAA